MLSLKEKGFVAVPYPAELRLAVERAVEAWKQFCSIPPEIKKRLPYSNGAAGVGYELKDGSGIKGDRKENLDIALSGGDWLNANGGAIGNRIAMDFIAQAAALVASMKPLVLDFARRVEESFGIDGLVREVDSSEDVYFIRFIHYFGDRQAGEEIAAAHADQSGFTLHLFESAPGLQGLAYGGKWIDLPVSAGETVIIPAMQLQLRSQGQLPALCHRVIATPETAQFGRYSAVCFVQLKHTPVYDKETQGRLQEKFPGFNYGMTAQEFARLFKT